MFSLPRLSRRALAAVAFAGMTLGISSCATPDSATIAAAEPPPSPTRMTAPSLRHHYQPGAYRPPRNARVEVTTQKNFFAWLFAPFIGDGNRARAGTRTKKTTAPAVPAVPATKVHSGVLARSSRTNTKIVIDVGRQKVFLLVDGSVAVEAPVSTGRPGKHTPRGNFRVTERVRSGKISTIYGVGMPYWMRLSGSVYGVHAGYLPGYPASAGCIRLPSDAAQLIYDNTLNGTSVTIYSSWDGA